MSSSNPVIVTASRYSKHDFHKKALIAHLYDIQEREDFIFYPFLDNTKGLPTVYNQALDLFSDSSCIIFVHDDVVIEDQFLFHKIFDLFNNQDIGVVGLAGATNFEPHPKYGCYWHLCSKDRQTDLSGSVNHFTKGVTPENFHSHPSYQSVYGFTPKRCLVMDGLFLAVCPKKLNGARFDEQFQFHHYDLDFCLTCNSKRVKMSTSSIKVTHASGGESGLGNEWLESNKKFMAKWYPIYML